MALSKPLSPGKRIATSPFSVVCLHDESQLQVTVSPKPNVGGVLTECDGRKVTFPFVVIEGNPKQQGAEHHFDK